MKTTGKYPSWVDQYRGDGKSVKKRKNGYALYSCTSVYVKGGKPKSVQKYLGMITEKDGFIPKAVPCWEVQYLEYALSKVILLNFYHPLHTCESFDSDDLIDLGIISFIFDDVSLFSLQSSALTRYRAEELYAYSSTVTPGQIQAVKEKIAGLFEARIPDRHERLTVINGLKLTVIPSHQPQPAQIHPPEAVADILSARGFDYGS